ncbi:MAG TPA: metallophosphoesterase [bacterium]|nr:metallophosphoesterase [bacterium]
MTNKLAKYTTLFILLLVASTALSEPVMRIREIREPVFAHPAIVKAGDSFPMEIMLPEDLELTQVSLVGVNDTGLQANLDFKAVGKKKELTVFAATVPSGTPVALYNLTASFGQYSWDTQLHAVKVIDEFKDEFDFVHLTDIHFNVQHVKNKNMTLIRQKLLQDVSKQNPEFVLLSGDLGLDPETYDRDYVQAFDMLSKWLTVPVYIVPGNHEMYTTKMEDGREINGLEFWQSAYGPTYHSFDYGKFHFTGINTYDWPAKYRNRRDKENGFYGTVINAMISPTQAKWIQKDLEDAYNNGKTIIAYTHIPIETLMGGRKIGMPQVKVPGPSTERFIELLTRAGCTNLFVGHMHYNEIKQFDKLTEILTKAAGIGGGEPYSWGYRIVHLKNGKIADYDKMYEIGFDDL